ncbi:MAG: hypothetical protein WCE38_14280 [Burkholderiales bacterium]
MPEAKTCPECGNILQLGAVPRSLTAGRLLATDLLLWTTVSLFLAFLWSPRADGEIYAALGAVALVVWALVRARQRADLAALAASGQHSCERCGLRFVGDDLRRIAPPG